jgi:Family of unknown function (DUF6165)
MIFVPISIGELIDKMTILSIKRERISDPEKLVNINKEYGILYKVLEDCQIDENNELFIELYKVNMELWDWQDVQREHWRRGDRAIDIDFYFFCREEHILNDCRAALKKKINRLYSSEIVEEKQFLSYGI